MIHRLVLITVAIVMSGCAGRNSLGNRVDEEPPGSLRLISRTSLGHACATESAVFTAYHVVEPTGLYHLFNRPISGGFVFTDRHGKLGHAIPETLDYYRDLATLTLIGYKPELATIGSFAIAGDVVSWIEYNYETKDKALWPIRRYSKITKVEAGHLVLREQPEKGSSGTCVYNASNEVVGIIVWGIGVKRPANGVVGIAVALGKI